MSEINHEELSAMSGENEVKQAPKYEVPIIKINGNDDGFYKPTGKDTRETVENPRGVILKVRRSIKGYLEDEEQTAYFTREHDAWNTKLQLMEYKTTSKGRKANMVAEGTYQELKAMPEFAKVLSLHMVLYMALSETQEIVKVVVKGKGCGGLFDYFKEFEGNQHIYEYVTKIGSKEELMERLKKKYFAMTFTRGVKMEDEAMDAVADLMKEVNDNIQKVEEHHAKRASEFEEKEEAPVELPTVDQDEIPVCEDEPNEQLDLAGEIK